MSDKFAVSNMPIHNPQWDIMPSFLSRNVEQEYQQVLQREQIEQNERIIENQNQMIKLLENSSQEQQIELLKKLLSEKETQLNNDKLQNLRNDLNKEGYLLGDFLTVPSSASFEDIIKDIGMFLIM